MKNKKKKKFQKPIAKFAPSPRMTCTYNLFCKIYLVAKCLSLFAFPIYRAIVHAEEETP